MTEPQIAVGILSGKEIQFSFPDEFISSDGIAISGIQQAVYRKGKIYWQEKEYDELSFTPQQTTSSFFELQDVTIGINFHWERKEVQRFKGELKIIVEDDQADRHQYNFHRRLSHQRDFIRNERNGFFGTPESTCGYFPKLAT